MNKTCSYDHFLRRGLISALLDGASLHKIEGQKCRLIQNQGELNLCDTAVATIWLGWEKRFEWTIN
jgi:hypothetical protein